MKVKWYYSLWFIGLMFSQWYLVVPLIMAIVLTIQRQKEEAKHQQQWADSGFGDLLILNEQKESIQKSIQILTVDKEKTLAELEMKKDKLIEKLKVAEDLDAMREATNKEQNNIDKLARDQVHLGEQITVLKKEIEQKHSEIIVLDDEILNQEFGFYTPKYNLENSQVYKQRLEHIRNKQKQLAKEKQATHHSDDWTLSGSKTEGRKMNNENIKMTIYSFNTDCDNAISKAKFNNIDSIEKRIRGSYTKLNKMNAKNKIEIKGEYLELKLAELHLAYEYELIKEEEREEQRRIKEEMREEQKALKEIEALKKKIEKEETHFMQEISSLKLRLDSSSVEERAAIQHKILELEAKLALVEKDKEDVLNREQNTRAGYVYIISNIGSFGEYVYKIGMTRRLEPLDRVKELGDASVPFIFDVHAMIFSEDAPTLENALHKAFHHRRLNKVNERKEFFRVSLEEISDVVIQNHNKVVEFTKLAEAEHYRETLMLDKTLIKVAN
ncbi:DUF4041 domain-containing protein [Planococcus sp. ISL-109]|uniref:DUF4041 domain-containing protein n=1 Tax=Planococcus sp. ISL-109 TaxID=2819166 RepID=UPI001BE9AF7B|nr:DUF4041 domain-containing protein [Planococcus sp. ISL-109]MBT2584220.1 DUF4041 domain-containing protein [Planococcus sp. ISL-109]